MQYGCIIIVNKMIHKQMQVCKYLNYSSILMSSMHQTIVSTICNIDAWSHARNVKGWSSVLDNFDRLELLP